MSYELLANGMIKTKDKSIYKKIEIKARYPSKFGIVGSFFGCEGMEPLSQTWGVRSSGARVTWSTCRTLGCLTLS